MTRTLGIALGVALGIVLGAWLLFYSVVAAVEQRITPQETIPVEVTAPVDSPITTEPDCSAEQRAADAAGRAYDEAFNSLDVPASKQQEQALDRAAAADHEAGAALADCQNP